MGNYGQWLVSSLICHGRRARHYPQALHLCEAGDQFVCHAVGEILLLGQDRQVFEWQYGERAHRPQVCTESRPLGLVQRVCADRAQQ